MYGKHFDSMYEGSMIGAGAAVFAVWGYCIAKMRPPQFEVELNPVLLAFLLGEDEKMMVSAIEKLCSPDARSRSKVEDGRRLIRKGEYLYHVVNGGAYHEIRTNEEKRAYWRDQKRKQQQNKGEPKAETKPRKELSDSITIPENLNTEEFLGWWEKWLEHLTQKRKKPTQNAIEMQLDKLSKAGVATAIAMLQQAIEKNWQGLYEVKTPINAQSNGQKTGPNGEDYIAYLSNKQLKTPNLMTPEESRELMRYVQ